MVFVKNGIKYKEQSGEILVLGLEEGVQVGDLFIPDTVKNKPVTEIVMRAFCGTNIVTVSLPLGLRTIGTSAFADCPMLKAVNIGDMKADDLPYMLAIQSFAFANCSSLSYFNAWSRTTNVERLAFANCVSLQIADMFIRYLEPGAFKNCPNIKKLAIEEDGMLYDDSLQDSGVNGLYAIKNAKFSKLTLKHILENNVKIYCVHDSPLLEFAYDGYSVEIYSDEEEKSVLGIF